MPATRVATPAERVHTPPPAGVADERRLHRITELHALGEATAALRAAAAPSSDGADIASRALTVTAAVWSEGLDHPPSDDVAARDRLRDAVASEAFLSLMPAWIRELRESASSRPDTGACTIASALDLWSWTMRHFQRGEGARAEGASRAMNELSDAVGPLLAARCLALDLAVPSASERAGARDLRTDLCRVHAAHAAAMVGATCAELVFGYRRHPAWDAGGCACCYGGDEVDDLEGVMPGIASGARAAGEVIEADGSHAAKAGPCVRFDGIDTFVRLRTKLDGCLTGARLAKERAAAMIAPSATPTPSMEGRA